MGSRLNQLAGLPSPFRLHRHRQQMVSMEGAARHRRVR
jgi:hypothetical protein